MTVSRKKQYEVMKASKRSKDIKGVIAGGKRLRFGKSGAFITSDAGVAREIQEKYGPTGDVVISEIDDADMTQENRGGRRTRKTWSVPELPWK